MKKALIIRGSYRKNGFTNRLCDELAGMIPGYDVTFFDSCNERFAPCTGCNYCEMGGKCINRDLDKFFKAFETADLVVFASPVYNGTFTAPIKALIDRFQFYYTGFYASEKKQKIEKHRNAFFIAASGRGGEKSFAYMKEQLECAFTILNMELCGSVLCAHTDTLSDYDGAVEKLRRSLSDEQT